MHFSVFYFKYFECPIPQFMYPEGNPNAGQNFYRYSLLFSEIAVITSDNAPILQEPPFRRSPLFQETK